MPDICNMLRDAQDVIYARTKDEPYDFARTAMSDLREIVEHVEKVRNGQITARQFCERYGIQ